jgi:hypothetical protein
VATFYQGCISALESLEDYIKQKGSILAINVIIAVEYKIYTFLDFGQLSIKYCLNQLNCDCNLFHINNCKEQEIDFIFLQSFINQLVFSSNNNYNMQVMESS